TRVRRLEPACRPVSVGWLQGPRGALLLGLRLDGEHHRLPDVGVRGGGCDGGTDAQAAAAVLERRHLPSLATVIERPPAQEPSSAEMAMPQPPARRGPRIRPPALMAATPLVRVALHRSAAHLRR